jgi:hypothetical protein
MLTVSFAGVEMSHLHTNLNRLAGIEQELAQRLVQILPTVVEGRRTAIFFNRDFNPFQFSPNHYDFESDELLELACDAIKLRRLTDSPFNEGVAVLFLEACRENADLIDKHRLGPKRLAERLLAAIKESC